MLTPGLPKINRIAMTSCPLASCGGGARDFPQCKVQEGSEG